MRATTGVQFLFDPIEEQQLADALLRGLDFEASRAALIYHLRSPLIASKGWQRESRRRMWYAAMFYGLRPFLSRSRSDWAVPDEAPWGWRYLRDPGRDVYFLMPLWAFIPFTLWQRRWRWMIPLIRVGLMQGREGDYLWTYRPSLKVWESRQASLCYPHFTGFMKRCYHSWKEIDWP